MAKFVVEDFHKTALDALDDQKMREIRKKVVWAGAKVVEKEMKNAIAVRGHVVNGWMRDSVAMGEIHEDIDATWVEVYPQGTDPRGVSNAMKNQIINKGYYNKGSGRKFKKDPFWDKTRSELEPRILSVMEYQYDLCMKEINGG